MSINNHEFLSSLYKEFQTALTDVEKKERKLGELCLDPLSKRMSQSKAIPVVFANLEGSLASLKEKKIKDLSDGDQAKIFKSFAQALSQTSSSSDAGYESSMNLERIYELYDAVVETFRDVAMPIYDEDIPSANFHEESPMFWVANYREPNETLLEGFHNFSSKSRALTHHFDAGQRVDVPEDFYKDCIERPSIYESKFEGSETVFTDHGPNFPFFYHEVIRFANSISDPTIARSIERLSQVILLCHSQELSNPVAKIMLVFFAQLRSEIVSIINRDELTSNISIDLTFHPIKDAQGRVRPSIFRVELGVNVDILCNQLSGSDVKELERIGMPAPIHISGKAEIVIALDAELNPLINISSLNWTLSLTAPIRPPEIETGFEMVDEESRSLEIYERVLGSNGPLETLQQELLQVRRAIAREFKEFDIKSAKATCIGLLETFNERPSELAPCRLGSATYMLDSMFVRDHVASKGFNCCLFRIGLSRPCKIATDIDAETVVANALRLTEDINPKKEIHDFMFQLMLKCCTQDLSNPISD